MSAPKSVIKVKKCESGASVEYTSSVDQANYYLFELTRAALRDVGKFVKKAWQTNYYNHFKRHTGYGGKGLTVKVISNKDTKYPRMQIGWKHSHKGNTADGFYSYFQEIGTSKQPRLGLLTKAAEDNIAEIIKIESQYLSGLNEEAERLNSIIDEEEFTDEDK